jgi:predicted DNA-binding transcriptional regulator YafY
LDAKAYVPGVENPDLGKVEEISLFVSDAARIFLEENASIIAATERVSNGYQVSISAIDQGWLVRTMAGFGPEIAVIQPLALKNALSEHLASIRSLYV